MKKNKLKMYGIFSALAAAVLLLFCLGMIRARKISWEGDYFVDEYAYDENGEGSYRRQVIELHIEEAEDLYIRLEARTYLGQEAGLDVIVWNIISNEVEVPKTIQGHTDFFFHAAVSRRGGNDLCGTGEKCQRRCPYQVFFSGDRIGGDSVYAIRAAVGKKI